MTHWEILSDRGKNYSMIQWFDAVVECIEELREELIKVKKKYDNHIEHYHTP